MLLRHRELQDARERLLHLYEWKCNYVWLATFRLPPRQHAWLCRLIEENSTSGTFLYIMLENEQKKKFFGKTESPK